MSDSTTKRYDRIVAECRDLFKKKMEDYGPSWILFRRSSISDQVFIKAKRIRNIEELQEKRKIPETASDEYRGIVNYCAMALMKLKYRDDLAHQERFLLEGKSPQNFEHPPMLGLYDAVIEETRELMLRKNHDYGEAWKALRLSSITDEILVKSLRIKMIEQKESDLLVSEGLDAQYRDILNYCVFALMMLGE